jgi:hypothetical protein
MHTMKIISTDTVPTILLVYWLHMDMMIFTRKYVMPKAPCGVENPMWAGLRNNYFCSLKQIARRVAIAVLELLISVLVASMCLLWLASHMAGRSGLGRTNSSVGHRRVNRTKVFAQHHHTLFPPRGWGLGMRLRNRKLYVIILSHHFCHEIKVCANIYNVWN